MYENDGKSFAALVFHQRAGWTEVQRKGFHVMSEEKVFPCTIYVTYYSVILPRNLYSEFPNCLLHTPY